MTPLRFSLAQSMAIDYWGSKLWSGYRVDAGPLGEELFSRFTPTLRPRPVVATSGLAPAPPAAAPLVLAPDAFQFRRIGHCLAAILFGLVGAVLGRLIAAEDDRPNH